MVRSSTRKPCRLSPAIPKTNLQTRIQAVEHRAYPMVVDAFCRDRLTIRGRTVDWQGAP